MWSESLSTTTRRNSLAVSDILAYSSGDAVVSQASSGDKSSPQTCRPVQKDVDSLANSTNLRNIASQKSRVSIKRRRQIWRLTVFLKRP
jgi:hypothetical protein